MPHHARRSGQCRQFVALFRFGLWRRSGARKGGNATLVPESAVYRVLLKPERSDILTRLPHTLRGQVYIASGGRSLLLRAWRQAVAAVIRESGF